MHCFQLHLRRQNDIVNTVEQHDTSHWTTPAGLSRPSAAQLNSSHDFDHRALLKALLAYHLQRFLKQYLLIFLFRFAEGINMERAPQQFALHSA